MKNISYIRKKEDMILLNLSIKEKLPCFLFILISKTIQKRKTDFMSIQITLFLFL